MTMRRRLRLPLAMLCVILVHGIAHADPITFRVDPELTNAEFAVMHLGIAKQRGRFERARGTITLGAKEKSGRIECGIIPEDGQEGCGAKVTGRISRREFGMDFAYPLVGDDFDLEFAVTAIRVRDEGETEMP